MSCKSKARDEGRKAEYHFPSAAPSLRGAMGFTLIEVLIAMTLLSIMVVLLFSSLRICAKSWEQGESKITEVNEVAIVHNFFQQHLSSAIPLSDDFKDGTFAASRPEAGTATEQKDKTFSFQGKKQSLQFISVFPASAGRSGMQLFSVEPQQQDKEQVIKVSLTPFFPLTEGEEWRREEVVLLRHVSDFTLAYFGSADGVDKSSWQDSWLEKKVLPQLVKININTTNGVFWPEMIIDLKIAGAAGSVAAGTSTIGNLN